jgi:hypothetical protein
MVVLPEPMKPARQRTWGREVVVRTDGSWVMSGADENSQNASSREKLKKTESFSN